jgi:methylenetetrahydrofolate dehydrogenase (NADP+) / methenyltetrahydrofolate cyclohydrolase / formyltetrahydrofolate synthetase
MLWLMLTYPRRYALAADIQTIPGLPTAPGYLNVDVDTETGEIDGLF